MALWSKLIPELVSNAVGGKASADNEDLMSIPTGGFRHILPVPLATEPTKLNPSPTIEIPSESSNSPMGVQPALEATDNDLTSHTTKNNSIFNNGTTASGGVALSIVIVVGVCFLVLNICACAGVFYQRDRVRFKERLLQRQYKLRPALQTSQAKKANKSKEGGHHLEMNLLKSSQTKYSDQDKDEGESADCFIESLPHETSTSTMDPHVKVSQWITQEMNNQIAANTNKKSIYNGQVDGASSDHYDPRNEQDQTLLFPLLKKSAKETNVPSLGPVVEETPQLHEDIELSTGDSMSQYDVAKIRKKNNTVDQETSAIRPGTDETTTNTLSSGRRKQRTKSQLSLHRPVSKRDVAVGNDNDDNSYHDAMDSIRRLNLPKVLPDFPKQDIKLRSNYSAPSSEPLYGTSSQRAPPPIDSEIFAPDKKNKGQSTSAQEPSPLIQFQQSKDANQCLPTAIRTVKQNTQPISSAESIDEKPVVSSSSIIKTNLPQTMVVARHPRSSHNPVKTTQPHYNTASVPEPELVVRPGPRTDTSVGTRSTSALPVETADAHAVVHRTGNKQETRPRSRNSKSWYAQYSQSLISQSIDQESDAQET